MQWVRDQGWSDPIACVFELGDEGAGRITDALNTAKHKHDDFAKRLLSVSFEKKTNMWGLQAADILAYETAKQVLRTTGRDQRGIRRSLKRLLRRTELVGTYFDAAGLQKLLRNDNEHKTT